MPHAQQSTARARLAWVRSPVRDGADRVQVGVVSWGAEVKRRRCDDTRLPMVMANVSTLRPWIDDWIERLG